MKCIWIENGSKRKKGKLHRVSRGLWTEITSMIPQNIRITERINIFARLDVALRDILQLWLLLLCVSNFFSSFGLNHLRSLCFNREEHILRFIHLSGAHSIRKINANNIKRALRGEEVLLAYEITTKQTTQSRIKCKIIRVITQANLSINLHLVLLLASRAIKGERNCYVTVASEASFH